MVVRPGDARPSWTYDLSPENRFRPPLSADEWNINNQFRKTNIAKISFLRSLFLRASFLTLSHSLTASLSIYSFVKRSMTYSPFMLFLMSSHRAKAIVNLPLSSRNTRFRPYFPFFIAHARRRTEETIIYLLIRVTQIYPVKYLPGRVRIPPKCFLNDPLKIGHFHFPMFAFLYTPPLAESFIFRFSSVFRRRIRDNSDPSFSSGSKTRIRKF